MLPDSMKNTRGDFYSLPARFINGVFTLRVTVSETRSSPRRVPPGDLSDLGIELTSPELQLDSLPLIHQ